MAVEWQVIKLPVSTIEDFSAIESELAEREENSWDLEYVTECGGCIIMFFKKKE
jgi:hypothetical protein